ERIYNNGTSYIIYIDCFLFSSRRRHTRSKRDWSSDVCSSDLNRYAMLTRPDNHLSKFYLARGRHRVGFHAPETNTGERCYRYRRSEERRVGKEWEAWGAGNE